VQALEFPVAADYSKNGRLDLMLQALLLQERRSSFLQKSELDQGSFESGVVLG